MMTPDPFSMCTDNFTFHAFRNTTNVYEKLISSIDPKNPKKFCSESYLNKNRMNVVTTLLSNSVNLWNSANCDECYINKTAYTFSNNTKHFLDSLDVFNECIRNVTSDDQINNTAVCVDCIGGYQTLNGFYEQIKKESINKICFDVEDRVSTDYVAM